MSRQVFDEMPLTALCRCFGSRVEFVPALDGAEAISYRIPSFSTGILSGRGSGFHVLLHAADQNEFFAWFMRLMVISISMSFSQGIHGF